MLSTFLFYITHVKLRPTQVGGGCITGTLMADGQPDISERTRNATEITETIDMNMPDEPTYAQTVELESEPEQKQEKKHKNHDTFGR